MTDPARLKRIQTAESIAGQATALGFKMSKDVAELTDRRNAPLYSKPTDDEVAAANTPEEVAAILDRIARAAAFDTPEARRHLETIRHKLDSLYLSAVESSAVAIYDKITDKLNPLFDRINSAAGSVPLAFAEHPENWQRFGTEALDAYRTLKAAHGEAKPLFDLLNSIAISYTAPPVNHSYPFLNDAARLHVFYSLRSFETPSLVRLIESAPSDRPLALTNVVYYVNAGATLYAQPLSERRESESLALADAEKWIQSDRFGWVTLEQAEAINLRARRDGLAEPFENGFEVRLNMPGVSAAYGVPFDHGANLIG